jgi:hypothetical protein
MDPLPFTGMEKLKKLKLASHLKVDLQRAVFNVCISVLHHTCHCSTSQKVAGSIPDGVNGVFH